MNSIIGAISMRFSTDDNFEKTWVTACLHLASRIRNRLAIFVPDTTDQQWATSWKEWLADEQADTVALFQSHWPGPYSVIFEVNQRLDPDDIVKMLRNSTGRTTARIILKFTSDQHETMWRIRHGIDFQFSRGATII
jgi:hypothetical protein